MKTAFYDSKSVQVKSINGWNNNMADNNTLHMTGNMTGIIIHFTTEDLMKRSEVIKKMKNTLLWQNYPDK